MAIVAAIIAGAAGVAGSAISASGAKKSADAQSAAAAGAGKAGKMFSKSQLREVDKFGDRSRDLISGLSGAFVRGDNAFSFIDETSSTFDTLFKNQTAQQRDNLSFILGDTEDELRTAQVQNAELASGNFSNFLDSLRADTTGILANTEGRPVGSFENLSAENQLVARSRGLSNTLAINDFFAREGTVDPPSALSVFGGAFDISNFEANENAKQLAFQERQLDRALGLEESLFGKQFEAGRLGLLAEAGALQGAAASVGVGQAALGQTVQSVGSAVSSYAQAQAAQEAAKANKETQEALNSYLRSQAI